MKNKNGERVMGLTKLIPTVTMLACLTSCSSIFSKSVYDVRVESKPTNRPFKVFDKYNRLVTTGRTPATIELKSSAGYFDPASYTVKYKSGATSMINTSYSATHILNLFVPALGIIWAGLIVDPRTGAMWNLDESVTTDTYVNNSIKIEGEF